MCSSDLGAILRGQHRSDVVGNILRPLALLQDLPVDQPHAPAVAIDVARVGVAMDEAAGLLTNLSGERLERTLELPRVLDRSGQILALRAIEQGLESRERHDRGAADLVEETRDPLCLEDDAALPGSGVKPGKLIEAFARLVGRERC